MKAMRTPRAKETAASKTVGLIAIAAIAAAIGLAGCATAAGGDVTGVWGTPNEKGTPSLELASDKSVSGTDGCNRLAGTWTLRGDTIEFGAFASTLMACEGVDTWLSGAKSATVSGSTMTVQDDSGAEIGTLERGG
jgi:heat shock protein HslJ